MTDVLPNAAGHPTDRLIGTAPAIAALRAQIRHLASFDTVGSPHVPTVLLQGETGTGKGLVARIMHDSGPRAAGVFVEVNCGAIPDTMLEAELFGFEPEAFTDARRAKPGLFEAASGGPYSWMRSTRCPWRCKANYSRPLRPSGCGAWGR
jgi:transcriptional regulator with PAS, ATPase and Fis domain